MSLYSSRVENALHLMLNLARAGEAAAPSARELASFQRLPIPFVRRILTELASGGAVVSSEGLHGGWRLARHADDISVQDVVAAVQGDAALFECREIRARCALWPDDQPPAAAVTGRCAIHAVMLSAESAMRNELTRHTIGDLVRRVQRKSATADAAPKWFATTRQRRVAAPSHEHDDE
ncbi:MAG: Rrf2 family transcriptional regulator [Burkholderiaceae bacterium]|nr:Rrf2 family transcriptional regulator [Burkholderiaceae bacterium]